MKYLTILILAFSLLLTQASQAHILTQEESNKIFDQINLDDDNTLEGTEIPKALTQAAKKIFEKAEFYQDESLLTELGQEYAKEIMSTLNKPQFHDVLKHFPTYAKSYRENAYKDILKSLDMKDVLQDPDVLQEFLKHPDLYGITHGAHQHAFDDIAQVLEEAASVMNDLKEQLSEILRKNAARDLGENWEEVLNNQSSLFANAETVGERGPEAAPEAEEHKGLKDRIKEKVIDKVVDGVKHYTGRDGLSEKLVDEVADIVKTETDASLKEVIQNRAEEVVKETPVVGAAYNTVEGVKGGYESIKQKISDGLEYVTEKVKSAVGLGNKEEVNQTEGEKKEEDL